MRSPVLILSACLLSACGMKGDLFESETPAVPEAPTEPVATDADHRERKTIPPTPDPAQTE